MELEQMNAMNSIRYICRVCLETPDNRNLIFLNENLTEKIDYVGGALEKEECEQLPEYICDECEVELEFVYNFIIKIKLSKIRIKQYQHNTVVEQIDCDSQTNAFKQSPIMHEHEDVELDDVETESVESKPILNETVEFKPKENETIESKQREVFKIVEIHEPKSKTSPIQNLNICHLCSKQFSTKANLYRHVREHQGRRFVCEYENCNSFFTQRSSLKIDTLKHKGEKPFVCFLCNKGFAQHKSLQFHLRVHTGEKPYTCDYCKNSFNQKFNLIRHFKSHAKPSKPKEFQCNVCEKFFATKQSLLRHYVLHERQACDDIFSDTKNIRLHNIGQLNDDQLDIKSTKF